MFYALFKTCVFDPGGLEVARSERDSKPLLATCLEGIFVTVRHPPSGVEIRLQSL